MTSPVIRTTTKDSAPIVRFIGERSKLIPNFVQNHHADNSLALPIPSFL